MANIKKITVFVLIYLFAWLCMVGATGEGAYYNVMADTPAGVAKLDETDVLEDLRSDENFDLNHYPFDKKGKLTLLSFNEYCYSFYEDNSANYGLYLYVYNPQALDIVTDSALNRIQMAVSYDANGRPNDYENFTLRFCSVSNEHDYYRLFYKFKVVDHVSADGLTLRERVNSNERRYDVSSVELLTDGNLNAIDYGVSKTFYFSGFASGYGPNPEEKESTLTCSWEKLETVELDVHHTYWRSESSSKGQGYQYQLD
ncbi:MAG: hypothetical protein IKT32_00385, partial [Clostridia bacterium]|nr:hypothetical protein [Clostridia bacterium]